MEPVRQLCLERQSNHRVQLSQIETEKMLVCFVEEELRKRKEAGIYKGAFSAVCSHLGYQARSALPRYDLMICWIEWLIVMFGLRFSFRGDEVVGPLQLLLFPFGVVFCFLSCCVAFV